MLTTVPRNFLTRNRGSDSPKHASCVNLRLATGECFVVTLQSWWKFLARLENNSLTSSSTEVYSPSPEGHGSHGTV